MHIDPDQAERLHKFAHDLRNRLIGMQQVIERLQEETSAEERAEFVIFGEQQFFKALREVEMVMDDLGVVRGTVTPVPTRLLLPALISTHVDHMRYRFDRKQQTVVLELDDSIHVMGDERILGDLVDALLSNASKFSDPGSVITVRTTVKDQEVLLDVIDTGTGLSSADLEQVFVRFAWLSNRPTGGESQGRGTLARAKQWAMAHQGDLHAVSNGPGKGCCFTLRLPTCA
ncbi:MAG: HAMP domain-containing histidine kinase [Flavobacteriales bacterium]|jgi:signal transduction histidine kinase|nr:HAMP domain-containing histidine kinase [Flavobacteriales bacterium]MBK6551840.1 HAMP domain-containing histidine kinase [Flavobacteriales bacterium]MBK6882367.1 HAMP domain-containing histidine kinase [Flavobacteriales bacterium]MBK7112123.1 HAMP domain-containing histidine kinase [Flavobacteriales bacterium]MBK7618854.1 HAMP domain-containing histidine kinase [Flavobacteriales bacterium]